MKTALNSGAPRRAFWREAAFYAALVAGPLCWLGLEAIGQPVVGPPPMLMWLKLALLMPVLEEIVFRGGIQTALYRNAFCSQSWFGISVANLLTSVVFAAMHLISQPPLWAALVFVPSLVFGWARDRYTSIVPSVILHAVYNAGFVWFFVA